MRMKEILGGDDDGDESQDQEDEPSSEGVEEGVGSKDDDILIMILNVYVRIRLTNPT